jgi:4-hydroxy-tetrahydrodipicolinate synthase
MFCYTNLFINIIQKQMLTSKEMTGLWAGLPVAWNSRMEFDEEVYRADVERTCKAGVSGIYTSGTTGEFYAMEFDEWKSVTRATIEECKLQHTPVMIGVTSTYTLGAVRRAAFAFEAGADAVQVALPFWMEVSDSNVIPFFKAVNDASRGLALTVYDTLRTKKILSVDMHRAIKEATGCYFSVKSNSGTVGCTPEGCRQLSEFVNVWAGENEWNRLGPYGLKGCASALVYMNPRIMLNMFNLLRQKKWSELQTWTDKVDLLISTGLTPFVAKGFTDTAFDHLMGAVTGFLTMNVRSRGPYTSATEEDVLHLRQWMRDNTPELLNL